MPRCWDTALPVTLTILLPLRRMAAERPKAMELAMKDGNVLPEQVDYVNAHGTSTHHNDLFETMAIHKAFGDAAGRLKVNSTKSMVGHLLGAAGGVEAIVCVKSITEGYVHPTVGLRKPGKAVIWTM